MLFFKKKQSEPAPKEQIREMVSIRMQDGSLEEYDKHFIITDKKNCVVCQGKFYHTSLDCENLEWEMKNCEKELTGMDISEAKKQGMTYCMNCSKDLWEHERSD